MSNSAITRYAVEFHCRSAADHRKRGSISAVGRYRPNGFKMLIAIRFPALRRRFSRPKTGFSAGDSGIGRAPARLRPVARDRGNAQLQVLVAELETKARRQTRRPETLAAGV
jgi:hypothetical protein